MASRTSQENVPSTDISLPFAALQLLAPPVRLVSAALWKVMKQRDVMQYGVVEEFVTTACKTVPGLLTARHRWKLTLGLRAKLILELCSTQPDVKVIQPHLEKICDPAASSSSTEKKDVKIMKTVEQFNTLVHTLLTDAAERDNFFKEEFPVEYGPKFDQELEKLLWEFLIRLDQLLPVPNLAQTVSWLSDAPTVLAECAHAATQPQLLEVLLRHQTCLGHIESAASLPPNMGDSILASLSLPPSGRVATKTSTEPCGSSRPQMTPVFGLLSHKEVPIMRTLRSDKLAKTNQITDPSEIPEFTSIRRQGEEEDRNDDGGGRKRKEREGGSGESDEEEVSRLGRKKLKSQESKMSLTKGRENDGIQRSSRMQQQDVSSLVASCIKNQPRVVIKRLCLASLRPGRSGKKEIASSSSSWGETKTKSPVKLTSCRVTPEWKFTVLDDKENLPVLPSASSAPYLQNNATDLGVLGDDYVADSEDESTKNFKVRLFMKRYRKTKHGTFVPTLREFWKPHTSHCGFLSAGSKHR